MIKHAEKIEIGNLIGHRQPFVVRPYQWDYAWEADDIKDVHFAKEALNQG